MCLHVEGSGQYLITKSSLPKSLVFNGMGVSVTNREIDVKVLDLFWDLFLQSTLLLFDLNDAFVSAPVSLHICQCLLEKEGQVLSLGRRYGQTFSVNMRIFFGKLFKEDNYKAYFIESLQQALLVVVDLCEGVSVETNRGLLVIYWG